MHPALLISLTDELLLVVREVHNLLPELLNVHLRWVI